MRCKCGGQVGLGRTRHRQVGVGHRGHVTLSAAKGPMPAFGSFAALRMTLDTGRMTVDSGRQRPSTYPRTAPVAYHTPNARLATPTTGISGPTRRAIGPRAKA
jgi:hypothetical protein